MSRTRIPQSAIENGIKTTSQIQKIGIRMKNETASGYPRIRIINTIECEAVEPTAKNTIFNNIPYFIGDIEAEIRQLIAQYFGEGVTSCTCAIEQVAPPQDERLE
jgi:hypothetical protein